MSVSSINSQSSQSNYLDTENVIKLIFWPVESFLDDGDIEKLKRSIDEVFHTQTTRPQEAFVLKFFLIALLPSPFPSLDKFENIFKGLFAVFSKIEKEKFFIEYQNIVPSTFDANVGAFFNFIIENFEKIDKRAALTLLEDFLKVGYKPQQDQANSFFCSLIQENDDHFTYTSNMSLIFLFLKYGVQADVQPLRIGQELVYNQAKEEFEKFNNLQQIYPVEKPNYLNLLPRELFDEIIKFNLASRMNDKVFEAPEKKFIRMRRAAQGFELQIRTPSQNTIKVLGLGVLALLGFFMRKKLSNIGYFLFNSVHRNIQQLSSGFQQVHFNSTLQLFRGPSRR